MRDLERWLEALRRVAPQRWLLGAWAVGAALLATLAAGASGGGGSLPVSVVAVAFATGAAIRPSTHTALGVVVVVTWQWLATTRDALSPLAVAVAVALLVFHASIALSAVTPTAATLDRATVVRWAQRTVAVALATVATWATTLLLAQREAAGSVLATFTGLVTVIVLLVAMRRPRRAA
jgi:hypothetical protein